MTKSVTELKVALLNQNLEKLADELVEISEEFNPLTAAQAGKLKTEALKRLHLASAIASLTGSISE